MTSEDGESTGKVGEWSSQEELDAALLECAAKGTYPEAKRLLKLGAKTDVVFCNGKEEPLRSALGNAAWRGHYQLVKLFLEHDADPDVNEDLAWKPLAEAICNDDERMVQLLLVHGADPNSDVGAGSEELQTPMHVAMSDHCDNPQVVRLLLKHGASPNYEHRDYHRPLHYVAVHGGGPAEYKKLKVLFEEDVDVLVSARNEDGYSPLELAIRRGNRETFENMLRFDAFRELENHRWLHIAARCGRKEWVKYLVTERECEINSLCRGATPLQVALDNNCSRVVQWITKHGGQVAPPGTETRCPCYEQEDYVVEENW